MKESPNKFAEVSSFTHLKTAEDAISKTIANHKDEIDSWIKHSGPWSQKKLELELNEIIGHGITSENRVLNNKTKVRVVLFKTEDGQIFVKTAYPIQ